MPFKREELSGLNTDRQLTQTLPDLRVERGPTLEYFYTAYLANREIQFEPVLGFAGSFTASTLN